MANPRQSQNRLGDEDRKLLREELKGLLDERDQRREEERDPNKQWLRRTIREEVGGILRELLGEEEESESKREEDGGLFGLLQGGKR
jgi:hypothetical protein